MELREGCELQYAKNLPEETIVSIIILQYYSVVYHMKASVTDSAFSI